MMKLSNLIEQQKKGFVKHNVQKRRNFNDQLQYYSEQYLGQLYSNFNIDEHKQHTSNNQLEFNVKNPDYPQADQVIPSIFPTEQQYAQFVNSFQFVEHYISEIFGQVFQSANWPIKFKDCFQVGKSGGWLAFITDKPLQEYYSEFTNQAHYGRDIEILKNYHKQAKQQFDQIGKFVDLYMKKFHNQFINYAKKYY